MQGDGLRWGLLAVVITCTGLGTGYAVARFLNLDPGFAGGLVSGALTESPAIGTATEAINALPLPEAERNRLVGHVAVADALCYVFGAFGVIMFCSALGPTAAAHRPQGRGGESRERARARSLEARCVFGLASVRAARLPHRGGWPGRRQHRRADRGDAAGRPDLHRAHPPQRTAAGTLTRHPRAGGRRRRALGTARGTDRDHREAGRGRGRRPRGPRRSHGVLRRLRHPPGDRGQDARADRRIGSAGAQRLPARPHPGWSGRSGRAGNDDRAR